jgi:TrmH family RNA methyltransferase
MQLMGWEKIVQVLKRPGSRIKIYLADVSSGTPYTKADFRGPLALIIGSEAEGAGDKSRSLADERVHIPMPGGSESLNAGIAASILLFEILRQRDE